MPWIKSKILLVMDFLAGLSIEGVKQVKPNSFLESEIFSNLEDRGATPESLNGHGSLEIREEPKKPQTRSVTQSHAWRQTRGV